MIQDHLNKTNTRKLIKDRLALLSIGRKNISKNKFETYTKEQQISKIIELEETTIPKI